MWYNGDMINVNVLSSGWTIAGVIASFFVAAVALGLGVASIIQTKNLQKRERKERLLNEIIEWAEDIRKSSSESIDPNKIEFDAQPMQIASQQGFIQLRWSYQSLNTKSGYMKEAISKVFGYNLLSAVEKVIQVLDEAIEILEGCITSKAKENSEKVEKYRKSLDCCAEKLIIEATKIKTRDIS